MDKAPASVELAEFDDVDSGGTYSKATLLYQGPARDLVLAVKIREKDEGDPNAFKGVFAAVIQKGIEAGATAAGGPAGTAIASVAGPVAELLGGKLSELTGAADDDVDSFTAILDYGTLAHLVATPETGEVPHDLMYVKGSDSEGRYEIFFKVVAG